MSYKEHCMSSVLFLPKLHNLGLIMKRHQTNLIEEHSTKMLPYNLQKHQGQENERLGPHSRRKRLERQPGAVHNHFVIKYIIKNIVEAWIGGLDEEYVRVCYTIFHNFLEVWNFQNRNLKQKALEWLEYIPSEDANNSQLATNLSEFRRWSRFMKLPVMITVASRSETDLKLNTQKLLQNSTCENSHMSTTAREAINDFWFCFSIQISYEWSFLD